MQVPMTAELKTKAEKEARLLGFSSLQGLVRFFLRKLVANKVNINVEIRR